MKDSVTLIQKACARLVSGNALWPHRVWATARSVRVMQPRTPRRGVKTTTFSAVTSENVECGAIWPIPVEVNLPMAGSGDSPEVNLMATDQLPSWPDGTSTHRIAMCITLRCLSGVGSDTRSVL